MIAECASFGAMANHKKASRFLVAGGPAVAAAVFLVTVGALSPPSCARKDDGSKPAGIPAMAPGSSPASPSPPAAMLTPPPAMPSPQAGADEPAGPPPAPDGPIDPKHAISGMVVLPGARQHDVAATDTIFLVARRIADNPQARGTLVAVKKLSAATFPVPFTLSARDMMIPTGSFDGDVSLAVRVDKDGDPMTRRKGDVFGGLPKVAVGARGVKLTLDQVQTEDESLAGSGPMGASPHGAMPPGHP